MTGRLSIVEQTKLNIEQVVVVVAGGSALELELLVQVFAGFGARQLKRAENAQQLSAAVMTGEVDLVVIDAAMGLDDALQVVRTLRRCSDDRKFTPVVLTSSNVSEQTIEFARSSGVNYVVAKPVAPRVLFERLVWIVRDKRAYFETEHFVGPDRRTRPLGPPIGVDGRRSGDLSGHLGAASEPNMSQADIDALMFPVRKAL